MAESGTNPKYDNAKVLLADVSVLKAGDLILTRNRHGSDPVGRLMSETILRTTGGSFDHVMVCTAPPTLIEALTGGVGNLSLARCFAHDISGVRVLRYRDAAIAAIAASNALTYVGRPYTKAGAAASIFPIGIFGEISGNNIFCSALVAQVYRQAGAAEFLVTPVEKTTPATIERMVCLADVTNQVFSVGLAPMNIEQMTALDGDRMPSPVGDQGQIFAGYMRTLEPMAKAIIATYPEARLTAPQAFMNCLQFLMAAMNAEPRVRPEARAAFTADVAAFDAAAFALLDSGAWETILDVAIAQDERTMARDLEESGRPNPDIDRRALRALGTATSEQLKSRTDGMESIRSWGVGRSQAMDRYVAIADRSIANLRKRAAVISEIERRLGPTGR